VTPRIAEVFIMFVITWLFLGNLYLGSGEGKNENYFESKSMNNILLRSMAARREGRTYSYCVVVLWTVIITIGSVVLPAYIIFMAPTIFFVVYSGEVLTDMATLFLLFDYILKWEQKSLYLIQFAACLTAEQRVGTTTYVQGARATAEIRAQSFAYLWYGGILMFVLIISYHFRFGLIWMWILPISMVYFFIVTHAMPYCMHGWPICPNDTGACVFMTALATIIVFLLLFFLKHGCFLFPCLCVPDVPGWAFFPPNTAVWSPLRGVWDVNAGFFLHPFSRLWAWATTPFDDEKCMWEPQPENYKSQACPLPQRAPFSPSQPTTRLARRRPSYGACGASPASAPTSASSQLTAAASTRGSRSGRMAAQTRRR